MRFPAPSRRTQTTYTLRVRHLKPRREFLCGFSRTFVLLSAPDGVAWVRQNRVMVYDGVAGSLPPLRAFTCTGDRADAVVYILLRAPLPHPLHAQHSVAAAHGFHTFPTLHLYILRTEDCCAGERAGEGRMDRPLPPYRALGGMRPPFYINICSVILTLPVPGFLSLSCCTLHTALHGWQDTYSIPVIFHPTTAGFSFHAFSKPCA